MIDSEQVPWGKGEKHPSEGGEIVPETIYLQGIRASIYRDDCVPIEEWANELLLCGLHKFRLENMWSESEG